MLTIALGIDNDERDLGRRICAGKICGVVNGAGQKHTIEGNNLRMDNRIGTAKMPFKIGSSKRDLLSKTSVLLRRLKLVRLIQQFKHRISTAGAARAV
jgi:hypothetical protein